MTTAAPKWLPRMNELQPLTQEDYELLLSGKSGRKECTIYNAELNGIDLCPKHVGRHLNVGFVGCKLTNCSSVGGVVSYRLVNSYVQNCYIYGGEISSAELTFINKCVLRDLQLLVEGAHVVLICNSLLRQVHSTHTDSVWDTVDIDDCRLSMCKFRAMTWKDTAFRRCRFYRCEFGEATACLSRRPFERLHMVTSCFVACKFRQSSFLHVDMMRYGGFRNCTFEQVSACGSDIGVLEESDTDGLNLDFAAVRYGCQTLSPKVGARHLAQMLCHVAHVDLSALLERVEAGAFPDTVDADLPANVPMSVVYDMLWAVYHVRKLAAGVFGTFFRHDVEDTVPDDQLAKFLCDKYLSACKYNDKGE